jgi:tetratricopeptide (TPR) repeat protein
MRLLAGNMIRFGNQGLIVNFSTPYHVNHLSSESYMNNLVENYQHFELDKGSKMQKSQLLSECFGCLTHTISSLTTDTTAQTFSLQSEIFLEQGTICNDLSLYKSAVDFLTKSIKLNPLNKNAYIERATAYFELNQLSLALKDYQQAKKLTISPPFKSTSKQIMMEEIYIPQKKKEFSVGLVAGALEGAKYSTKEFIPSILNCCRGILNGLWAFALAPKEVSQEMINSAYALGEFIASHSALECLECAVPELHELSSTWKKTNDYSKGQKIGYIIGKYGVDIFAPVGVIKGANKIRTLKRANAMCTLEGCTISKTKRAKILEESSKLAKQRELIINEASKKASILVKTPNVCHHVMQDHHHWGKILKLTGNKIDDFKEVLKLIEINKIVHEECLKTVLDHKYLPIKVLTYTKNVNGQKICVIMENYTDKGEIFLKNAYIETRF